MPLPCQGASRTVSRDVPAEGEQLSLLTPGPAEVRVTEWSPAIRFICPPPPPDECDCGHVGRWDVRLRLVDGQLAGSEERCPGCGDVEIFDPDGRLVGRHRRMQPA